MSRLDAVQVEQLEEIGTYLQAIRERQGKSLDEIATKTFIPLRLLKAIEAGNAHPLPEPVFVQGFIRRYAEALGLDGRDLSQRFSVEATVAPQAGEDVPTLPIVDPASLGPTPPTEPSVPKEPPPAGQLVESVLPSSPHRPNWVPAYVVGGLIVLIGLGYVGMGRLRPPTEVPKSPEALTASEVPRQLPQSAPEPPAVAVSPTANTTPANPSVSATPGLPGASAPAQPSPAAKNTGPVVVNVSFQGTSWVEVAIDGEVVFEGTLEAGTQRTWSGKEQVTIVAGNAGAVLVSYNQGKAVPMGELGEVQERSFPPAPPAPTEP